ncbi:MAG: efflux RND transporter periplasmic adaptor subunit [Deltaproteobacteria bacterium]|jgi:membrane fusion protein (multidrug efflux system)|nr:efflux RND transporter periplasmic adaptor subunit [Deltaproteobacteria bacterium]
MTLKQYVKKRIFVIIPALIVLAAAIPIAISVLIPSPAPQYGAARVTLSEARKTPVKKSWRVIARLEADQRVELVARVAGFLEEIKVKEGQSARQGDVLFQIEPQSYQAALSQAQGNLGSAEAQLTQAQLSFDRVNDLYRKKSAPKSDLDAAQATLDVALASVQSAQALLAQAKLNLDYASVKAPFDGTVSDSPFSVGSYVGPQSGVLATIVSDDPVEATFGVPDRLLADLRFGASGGALPSGRLEDLAVKLWVNENNAYPEEGRITYVAPLIDSGTDTAKVKATFPNPQKTLVPGEFVTVVLEDREPREVILAPKNAVLISAQVGDYVYVTAPGPPGPDGTPQGLVAEIRPIKRGEDYPGGIEIADGLKVGEKIINLGIMSSGATLRPGTPIEVAEDYAPLFPDEGADPAQAQEGDTGATPTGGEGGN